MFKPIKSVLILMAAAAGFAFVSATPAYAVESQLTQSQGTV